MVSKFELSYHCAVERLASYIRFSPTGDKGLTPAVTSQMQPVIPNRQFNSGVRQGLFVLALALVTILAYRPAWNGGFLWDDDVYITITNCLRQMVCGEFGFRWIRHHNIFPLPTQLSDRASTLGT
jgi:hypothetical protein